MRRLINEMPILGSIARIFFRKRRIQPQTFTGSQNYWIERYNSGRNSGDGSYGNLAAFKAEIINAFVLKNGVKTIIEFGCGDGNQLKLATYPSYTGFDVSPKAVAICKKEFQNDATKIFKLMTQYQHETSDLTLSLDVIYHLIEDETFVDYVNKLFNSSKKFVIIYSSDTDKNPEDQAPHVKHRNITGWITKMKPEFKLIQHIPNRYPFNGDTKTGSFADFFIYEKI